MTLSPKIEKDAGGTYWLRWTPDPTAEGYAFTTPGGKSRTFNAALDVTKLGKNLTEPVVATVAPLDVTSRAAETAAYPPVAPPPAGVFGAAAYEGFEWVLEEPVGQVANVTTNQELNDAIFNSGAVVIDGGGRTFTPGQIKLPAHSAFRVLQNVKMPGARVLKMNTSKWRLRGSEILNVPANLEDCVKGEGGAFFDIDRCFLHHADRQGIYIDHSDVVIRNTRVWWNGAVAGSNQSHGIYTKRGQRLLMLNNAFYDNEAFQLHYYTSYHHIRAVCNTISGGRARGGAIIGSENDDPTSDVLMVGTIVAKSPGYGFSHHRQSFRITLADSLCWQNASGDYQAVAASYSDPFTIIRPRNGDPKFRDPTNGDFSLLAGSAAKGIVGQEYWKYVPATDIAGRPRVTADAGAWAAA